MKLFLLPTTFIASLFFSTITLAQPAITDDPDVDRLIRQLSQDNNEKQTGAGDEQAFKSENPNAVKQKTLQTNRSEDDEAESAGYPETESYSNPVAEEWRHPDN